MKALVLFSVLALASPSFGQSPEIGAPVKPVKKAKGKKPQKNPAAEIGSGVGTAAGGVAKGAGSAATGAAKGAVDLVTLHPLDAGAAVGTGAAKAGKDVAVGSVKGVGKIGKGVGHALKKIL